RGHLGMEQELRSGGAVRAQSTLCFSGALVDGPRIQQLLLHCAAALESNDVTLAQQAMWVLNNIASAQGDPNQRLTSSLLRGLVARACRTCGSPRADSMGPPPALGSQRAMSVTELADYVDLTPWHRFGFTASNGAILRAVAGRDAVHVVDLGVTRCMQWPTLIDALSKRPGGPPALRITVPSVRPAGPPLLGVPDEEIGLRLANFAKSKGVHLEFNVVNKRARLRPLRPVGAAAKRRRGARRELPELAPARRAGLEGRLRGRGPGAGPVPGHRDRRGRRPGLAEPGHAHRGLLQLPLDPLRRARHVGAQGQPAAAGARGGRGPEDRERRRRRRHRAVRVRRAARGEDAAQRVRRRGVRRGRGGRGAAPAERARDGVGREAGGGHAGAHVEGACSRVHHCLGAQL
uniref:Uncharacterized protein n=1 Tax=Aegilops tauschii subsp. strangulata TaxID=200361 RepID=A0A452ZGI0_AEGTS